jgi:hypothetical protein
LGNPFLIVKSGGLEGEKGTNLNGNGGKPGVNERIHKIRKMGENWNVGKEGRKW